MFLKKGSIKIALSRSQTLVGLLVILSHKLFSLWVVFLLTSACDRVCLNVVAKVVETMWLSKVR